MKPNRSFLPLALGIIALTFAGCASTGKVTLAPGGVYHELTLAQVDQSINDAETALDGGIQWISDNAVFLSRWPEIAAVAANVAAHKDEWERQARAARTTYAKALAAYRAAGLQGAAPTTAAVDAAIAAIADINTQIAAYQAAHPVTK
jgi:hypothetical protein